MREELTSLARVQTLLEPSLAEGLRFFLIPPVGESGIFGFFVIVVAKWGKLRPYSTGILSVLRFVWNIM